MVQPAVAEDELVHRDAVLGARREADLLGRQRLQNSEVNKNHHRLLERADQVLTLRQIDPRLAAHAGVRYRKEGCGRLGKMHAAHERRCCEPGDVARDAAAQRQHCPTAVEVACQKLIVERPNCV